MLKTILNRPVAVLTVFIVVVIVSLVLSAGLPLDLYPDMELPVMAVTVVYPGAGPAEVEEDVVRVVEGELSGLEGLDSLTSTSSENFGMILMFMNYGTDLSESMADVRARLDQISGSLPADAESPVLQKFDPSSSPILSLAFEGDRTDKDMKNIAEQDVIPVLEAMDGVASVELEGLRESLVRVDVDQQALESYGLSLTAVSAVLSAQNFQLGAGSFEEAGKDILIRSSARFSDLEDIASAVVMTVPSADGGAGTPVLLSDLASVHWGYADPESLVRVNGKPGISLLLRKGSGANSVRVADAVKEALPEINASLPDGVELSLLTDSTGTVRDNLSQVVSAALLGILFAVLVLFVFLRQGRSTIIAALSIPVALAITLAGLAVTGRTLNLITLIGLSMGVGLIVDSSIVVIENISRLRQKGAPMGVSALRGAGEMMAPITASTLTTIAVFLPLIIYKSDLGFLGIFLGELAFIIIMALLASLAVAAVLVPVLSSRFLTIRTREEKPIRNRILRKMDAGMERGLKAMEAGYAKLLKNSIRHKVLLFTIVAVLFIGTGFLASRIDLSMMPESAETSLIVKAEFPTGTAVGETEKTMLEIQSRAAGVLENADRLVVIAEKGSGSLEITFTESGDTDGDVRRSRAAVRRILEDFPEVRYSFESSDQEGPMQSSGVDVVLTGTDWDAIMDTSDRVAILLGGLPGITEVENDAVRGLPEAEIIFDRRAMSEQGLNAASVAAEVRALTAGITSTSLVENGESYDVVLRLENQDRSTSADLERLFVVGSSGQRVSLNQFAEIRRTDGPTIIRREDQTRTVHVVGTLAEGAAPQDLTREVENLLSAELELQPGVSWKVGGEMDDFTETGTTMVSVMILAVLLVVAVMVAQFESFRDPLIIFLAMPLMFIGIVVLFTLTGTTLSMVAMMGIILLLGIVVNNGIVLVDHARLMRRRGMGVVEAAVESGRARLRPVLMTTLTTILAMTPMAFFPGEGGLMMQPMGLAIVGGLSTAMIGTLVMVPVFYTMTHRKEREDYLTRRDRRRIAKETAETSSRSKRDEEVA